MMEAEASLSSSQPHVFSSGQNDVVRDLLTLARQLITQGKPSEALQAVIFSSPSSVSIFLSFFIFFLHSSVLKILSLILFSLIRVLCSKCSSYLN